MFQPASHQSPPLFPVGLVLRGRPCLVVGGGEVAARKAAALRACEATVTVVAPEHSPAVRALAREGAIELLQRPYMKGEAASYRLVVAATGVRDVDQAVFDDAEQSGVWVNCADDPEHCSVMIPAVWRDGPVVVSVATGGASPAMSRWLRDLLAAAIPRRVGRLAELVAQARRQVIATGEPTHAVDWRAILDGQVPGLVASGQEDEAMQLIDAAARPKRAG